jgi:hypothetical protein
MTSHLCPGQIDGSPHGSGVGPVAIGVGVGPPGCGVTVGVAVTSVHNPVSSEHCCPSGHELVWQQMPPTQLPVVQSVVTEHAPIATGVERGVAVRVGAAVAVGEPAGWQTPRPGAHTCVVGSHWVSQQIAS